MTRKKAIITAKPLCGTTNGKSGRFSERLKRGANLILKTITSPKRISNLNSIIGGRRSAPLLKIIAILVLALASPVVIYADTLTNGEYVITGYHKQSKIEGNKIEVRAKTVKGFHLGDFNDIDKPELTVRSGPAELTIVSETGLLKDDEGTFTGKVNFKLTLKENSSTKVLLTYESKKPEESVHLTLNDMTLRASSSKIHVGDQLYEGGSTHIDIPKREIFWSQPVIKNKKVTVPGPYTIHF